MSFRYLGGVLGLACILNKQQISQEPEAICQLLWLYFWSHVCSLLNKATSWHWSRDQRRVGGLSDLFKRFIRFLRSPFHSIPPSFLYFLMSLAAELRSPRLSYRPSPVPVPRYICHPTHTDINTRPCSIMHTLVFSLRLTLLCHLWDSLFIILL